MQPSNVTRRPQLVPLLLVLIAGAALLAAGGWLWFGRGSQAARQMEVAARGASVMPFDLERTSHIFAPQADGGLQQVIADDPGDAEQIVLIRSTSKMRQPNSSAATSTTRRLSTAMRGRGSWHSARATPRSM